MNVVQSLLAHLNLDALQFRCLHPALSPRRRSIAASMVSLAAFAAFALANNASASQAFTSGSLVVERVGDGASGLTSASTPVSLFEFPSAGGAALQTINLPNAATRPTA